MSHLASRLPYFGSSALLMMTVTEVLVLIGFASETTHRLRGLR